MQMHPILVMLGFVPLVLVLAACGGSGGDPGTESGTGSAPAGDGPLIGLSMDTLREERWQRDRDLFVAAVEELGGRVQYVSANSNDTQQLQDVNTLLAAGAEVIVIVPHDGKVMAQAVDQAHQRGVPCIAYDRLVENTPHLACYLSFDNVKVGEAQGRFLVEECERRGIEQPRIVRIYGTPNDNNSQMFKAGQDQVVAPLIEAGTISVVHEDWCQDWDPLNATKITQAAIAKAGGADFDAVLASNDGTAAGAIQALEERQAAGKVIVTGQDAELSAIRRIVAGTQSMTVYKPLPVLARTAAEVAMTLAGGGEVAADTTHHNGAAEIPAVFCDITTVTADNIMETVVADGFHSYEDVYAEVPADERPPKPTAP